MRMSEILTEEQQLAEFLPVALGAGAMLALNAAFAAWTAYDIWKIFAKNGYDPDNMSDEDWDDLALNVIFMAVPGAAKLGMSVLKKLVPTRLLKWVKGKVMDKIKGTKPPAAATTATTAAPAAAAKTSTTAKAVTATGTVAGIGTAHAQGADAQGADAQSAPQVPKGGDPKVFALQQKLIAKGAKIKADGKMGPATQAAMKQFPDVK